MILLTMSDLHRIALNVDIIFLHNSRAVLRVIDILTMLSPSLQNLAFAYPRLNYKSTTERKMNHFNQALDAICEQAPTFEKSGIRFPEDHPIGIIPCLNKALTILSQQDENPHVFQMLIYFFSTLLSGPALSLEQITPDHVVIDTWHTCQLDLHNPYHFCYKGYEACRQFDAIIEQLDPVETFQQMRYYAALFVRHSTPTTLSSFVGEDYTIINRVHDWVVRCAFYTIGFGLPYKWKSWLRLMYEKQPYKILDGPRASIDEDKDIFLETLHAAANIGGFDAMIPVIKFWVRQALTVVHFWDVRFSVRDPADKLMPTYPWCVAAYEEMWYRFKNELRNPLSDYPYMVRDQVLCDIHYMRIFSKCWGWADRATQGIEVQYFEPLGIKKAVYEHVLVLVRDEFQPRYLGTEEKLEQVFGANTENKWYFLLREDPVVWAGILVNDLRPRPSLYDGLCEEFYPEIPAMTDVEHDAMYPDSDAEYYENEHELVPFDAVEMEAFGPCIDIGDFTSTKEADADDFYTICQEQITLSESDALRCVMPDTCSDTFHAECLEAWVNSIAYNRNICPDCQVEMTWYRRPVRAVATDEE
jgi:hypothetical protein